MTAPLKKQVTRSGQTAAVQTMRAKFDSIQETTLPLTKALNERIDRIRSGSPTPTSTPTGDPRREPNTDGRVDEEVPVDVLDDAVNEPDERTERTAKPKPTP